VDLRNVFSPLFFRVEVIRTFLIVVALDGFFFVVEMNVSRQLVDHLSTVDADFRFWFLSVVFRNVFVSFFNGQEVSGTHVVEVALDGFCTVESPDMYQQVTKRNVLVAVNALCFSSSVTLVNLDDVFSSVFYGFTKKSTSFVVIALDYFALVILLYVVM